jgi:hypothetical protein
MIMGGKYIEVISFRIIPVEPDTTVTLYTAIHFMIDKRSEILIPVGPFIVIETPVIMPGHHSHVLQVAFPSFITYRAIMRMVGHEPFDNILPELMGFPIIHGDPGTIGYRLHACHHQLPFFVIFVFIPGNGTLPT